MKWITVGEVQWPWFVFEMGSGSPGGYRIVWRGRVGVFQPVQFREAKHLLWAVERRLHHAKLQWVAMASGTKRGVYGGTPLRVLVRRINAETQRTRRS